MPTEPRSSESPSRRRAVARLVQSGTTKAGDTYITRAAVEGMVEQLQGRTLPVGFEHDPTLPPVGRILGGKLIEVGNGEVAVESVIEIFECETRAPLFSVSQLLDAIAELPPVAIEEGPLRLEIDSRSYKRADLEPLIADARVAGPAEQSDHIVRLSVGPDALLVIALGSGTLWFTKGFFTRLGEKAADAVSEDLATAYSAFKGKLRDLVAHGRSPLERNTSSETVKVIQTSG
jgi:hypothetical protein